MAKQEHAGDLKYYTLTEVAAFARVSVSTVRRHARAGNLRTSRVGKQIRICGEELQRYLGASPADRAVKDAPQAERTAEIVRFERGSRGRAIRLLSGETLEGLSWQIFNGDVKEGLKQVQSGTVNCVVTSPPYYGRDLRNARTQEPSDSSCLITSQK